MQDEPPDEPRPPSLPTTLEGFREAAAWYRSREAFHASMLRTSRKMADTYERWAKRMERGEVSIDLTLPEEPHHNRTEMQALVPLIRYRRGRPSASKHAFVLALEEREGSIAAWAEDNGLTRERVKGWVAKGAASRRIPREWAEKIEREFTPKGSKKSAVPATLATWPQGIS